MSRILRPLAIPSIIFAAVLLAGCNRNSATGNDREAQLDPAPTPAPMMHAANALDNIATALLKPETMTPADLAVLAPLAGHCAVRLTEVARPSFVFAPGATGTIKLNGKLIRLPATGELQYAESGVAVTLQPGTERGDAGLEAIDMILVLPGAGDEVGYSGFSDCSIGESR